jgi:hypothetical protein
VGRVTRCRECGKSFQQANSGRAQMCSPDCRHIRDRRQKADAQRRWKQRQAFADGIEIARIHSERLPGVRRRPFTAVEILLVQDAYANGIPAVRIAERYSVSTRTIHRVLELGAPSKVQVGRYVAWFAPKRYGPPVMLTEWIGAGSEVAA